MITGRVYYPPFLRELSEKGRGRFSVLNSDHFENEAGEPSRGLVLRRSNMCLHMHRDFVKI